MRANGAKNTAIPVLKYRLHPDDLLAHFYNLGQSFEKFASMDDTFKDLCDHDQKELLNENSLLFIMVIISYFLLIFIRLNNIYFYKIQFPINNLLPFSTCFHDTSPQM